MGPTGPEWNRRYQTEWGIEVGARVRRLRQTADLRIVDVASRVVRPDRDTYSVGFFSRMERGWATPSLWVYEYVASLFDVHPGRLLGLDDLERPFTEAELTLVKLLRRLGIDPDDAIARLVAPRPSAASSARPAS